jgi:hypothetical protein
MNTLSITNRTITLGSTIYQVNNITSVGKHPLKTKYILKLHFIIICSAFIGLGILLVVANPDLILLKWLTGTLAAFVGLGIFERFVTPKKYILSIRTNAGSAELIASKNQKLLNKIIDKITEIMNHRDVPLSYNFNIAEGDIINQSGSFGTGYSKSGN